MYKSPSARIASSLRREEAERTGKPCYTSYRDVLAGLISPTACRKIKKPVQPGEKPAAYVLNRNWLGYLPLYDRKET